MYCKIYWYVVTYPDGSQKWAVTDESCDTVQFRHSNAYFEAEAYHLGAWCDQHGFKLESGETEIELPIKEEV